MPHDPDVWRDRFPTLLVGIFAAVATLLAGLGCYGIVAFSVARRTREIGIRVALGARPHGVVAMLFGRGFRLVLAGIVLGTLGSFPLDIRTLDPPDANLSLVMHPGVVDRFVNRFVGVLVLGILADDGDRDLMERVA